MRTRSMGGGTGGKLETIVVGWAVWCLLRVSFKEQHGNQYNDSALVSNERNVDVCYTKILLEVLGTRTLSMLVATSRLSVYGKRFVSLVFLPETGGTALFEQQERRSKPVWSN